MTQSTPPTDKLLGDLEDLRDLLDDHIPVLSELAEEIDQAPFPLASPQSNEGTLDDDQIPLITDKFSAPPASHTPRTPKPQLTPPNPFLPAEKLEELASERATIEQLFHDQNETLARHTAAQRQQLEQTLKQEMPALAQRITDELLEEMLHELTLRLEERLQKQVKARLAELIGELALR